MTLQIVCVRGYRSIRHVYLPLTRLNVIVGPNGCGKTNLYKSLHLLHEAAAGRLANALADEGGMSSVLWAGNRKDGPVRLSMAVRFEQYSYELQCGLPPPGRSLFTLDPQVKEEQIHFHGESRSLQVLGRNKSTLWVRDEKGKRAVSPFELTSSESVLAEVREPHRFPELSMLRQELLGWRFYHHFRTDAGSPIREPQVGVITPVLSHDGRDLAAAIQTILEIGRADEFSRAVDAAFPGAVVQIDANPRFEIRMWFPGFQRPFDAVELSDGTLQYLCLLTALLTPRPPSLMAFNEPETSIHPDLLAPLARLFVEASSHTQLVITTHSTALAELVSTAPGFTRIALTKVNGETRVDGQSDLERAMTL